MPRKIRPIRIEGNIAYVPLTKGYEAVIDSEDLPLVDRWNWCALLQRRRDGSIRAVYAIRMEPCDTGRKQIAIRMHRVILGLAQKDLAQGDHADGDGLNNRRKNLRYATIAENRRNSRTPCHNTSGIKGVSWHSNVKKWQAYIGTSRQKKYLGSFDKIEDAASAYARASADIHGEFGRLA
ncbi:MAG: hypothetical protein ACRC14_02660 [Paracoccaceae bacterium]